MRTSVRASLLALAALSMLAVCPSIRAQGPPATKGEPRTTANPARPANFDEVMATVNGEKITRGDLIELLSRYPVPLDNPDIVYHDAVETLINVRLVTQYLNRMKIAVPEDEVARAVADVERNLKNDGRSLAEALVESNKSMEQLRKELADRSRWITFVKKNGTDATLKKFLEDHKDLLNGTMVKASHILLKVDPKATAAEKEAVHQKMVGIKKDVLAKKTTFAQAANKFSEDPGNSEGAGGDIGYFGLSNGIVEEFAQPAFGMKVGEISEPIETPYGYHLIIVTDRKEGGPIDFEQNRPAVLNAYAAELQKELLTAQRKSAKIDIKPMPADLFPAPSSTPGADGKPADTTKPATKAK